MGSGEGRRRAAGEARELARPALVTAEPRDGGGRVGLEEARNDMESKKQKKRHITEEVGSTRGTLKLPRPTPHPQRVGTDGVRTRDLRFTRPTPYHLATAPDSRGSGGSSQWRGGGAGAGGAVPRPQLRPRPRRPAPFSPAAGRRHRDLPARIRRGCLPGAGGSAAVPPPIPVKEGPRVSRPHPIQQTRG